MTRSNYALAVFDRNRGTLIPPGAALFGPKYLHLQFAATARVDIMMFSLRSSVAIAG